MNIELFEHKIMRLVTVSLCNDFRIDSKLNFTKGRNLRLRPYNINLSFQSSDFTTDEKFEILEQLTCVINHSRNSPKTVQASPNLIIFPATVQATVVSAISPFQNDIAGCKPPKVQNIEKRSSLLLQMNKSPSNFRQRIK